ncbi:MAG: iron-regulated protein [Alphaproteobacteria bacterium]|nr:iron-regulated protein [Alphaproteobacteria bacterium]
MLVLLALACAPSPPTAEAVQNYAALVEANYADALSAAEDLDAALEALVADPSQAQLDAARQAWLDAREPYLSTEVFRFYDGPIDDPDDGPEGYINAWPMDESYIDYTVDDPESGIIQGDGPIDAETLLSLNEAGGEANIATGFHAIEFLLWGQDQSDTGPGDRPYSDYSEGLNADRRGSYLSVTGELLVQHLGGVHAEWAAGAAYRSGFEAEEDASLEKILAGMIILAGFETGGERLQAALDSGDQEDEHSCFSDNTHRDMIQDIQGIKNVWTGSYGAVSGTSIQEVVDAVDPELAETVDARIDTCLGLAEALPTPFDQAIAPGAPGNADVQALVICLLDLEGELFEVFDAFGLSVSIPE